MILETCKILSSVRLDKSLLLNMKIGTYLLSSKAIATFVLKQQYSQEHQQFYTMEHFVST